jgi:septal ring factor EnvC (AmiA/AmiB activator)
MPVPEDSALRQFEIEALRQITDNLRRLNDKMDKQGDDIRSMDARLIRIESNSVSAAVRKLEEEVEALKRERDRRAGAFGLFEWMVKNWAGLVGLVLAIVLVLQATGRIDL